MNILKKTILLIALGTAASAGAENVHDTVTRALKGLRTAESPIPYSRTIKELYIGFDEKGIPKTGVAFREIESFKTITGVVIVDKTETGYILREAVFPDIGKIKNAKDRKQVKAVLKQFQNVPFDPHAEKSAVDALSGATRYGIKTSGYLNYLARHVALQMESPPEWTKP
ncbi:hypothetical protein [Pontiella agarivorans]|uniref:FMN-binding domain-containing protein n=1 Tax=Pontiella agarivorans TaxID=3038953 RepID=A0ABU5N033_9BACT|nr:hypothetical protein [Pontiella agarivorans]MDZ8119796.1 hypothetical protein [Pontiella agarivorans]